MSPQQAQKLQYFMSLINSSNTGQAEANKAMLSGNGQQYTREEMMKINQQHQQREQEMMRQKYAVAGANGKLGNEMEALKRQGAMGSDFQPEVFNMERTPNSDIDRYMELRNLANPNLPQEQSISMPVDIDGASLTGMTQEELNILLQKIDRMR